MSMRAIAIVSPLVAGACGTAPPPSAPPVIANTPPPVDAAPAVDAAPPVVSRGTTPLPAEPWYAGKPNAYADCAVTPAGPASTFVAPFDTCPVVAESWASPPGGSELHFHYLYFSPAASTAARATDPTACCYLIFEFPRHR